MKKHIVVSQQHKETGDDDQLYLGDLFDGTSPVSGFVYGVNHNKNRLTGI
jgi:hypothetical protein